MKKKNINNNSSKLLQLYNNGKLRTKVDNLFDEGRSLQFIADFCKEQKFDISRSSLSNYQEKRRESIETGVPLVQLLDKRVKDNVTYIMDKEVDSSMKEVGEPQIYESPVDNATKKLLHDLEFLDEIIAKGAKGLEAFHVVDAPLAMKAIDLKAKITGNQLQGLTIAGLRELKLRQVARETAIEEVIMQFVPEDQLDALFDAIKKAEDEFYENLDLSAHDRQVTEALRHSGIL